METKQKQEESKKISYGKAHPNYGLVDEFILPDGKRVMIRDRNGEDEEFITRVGDAKIGKSLFNFLARIIVEHEDFKTKPITPTDVANFKSKCIYYMILRSRLLAFGPVLKFDFEWPGLPKSITYEEDLSKYDWDLSNPVPGKDSKEYFEHRITPYLNASELKRTIKLTSSKQVRYTHLTGNAEVELVALKQDDYTSNTEFKFRSLELKRDNVNEWQQIQNFREFTARDMAEIRKDIKLYDSTFTAISDIPHPNNQDKTQISLLAQPDFLFPRDL